MNWGKIIIIVMITFILFIGTMVVNMIKASTDLESEDYYAKEVNFETEIQAVKLGIKEQIAFEFQDAGDFLVLQVPRRELTDVQVTFIRPNDAKLDLRFEVENTESYLIDKRKLVEGVYKVEISYDYQGERGLQKERILI